MLRTRRSFALRCLLTLCVCLTSAWLTQPATAQGLSADGAWIVYLTSTTGNVNIMNQVIAINPDGTGKTVLADGRMFMQLASSKLGYVSFVSMDKPTNGIDYQNIRLTVMQLPDGKVIKDVPLTNARTGRDPKSEPGTDFPIFSVTDVASITINNIKIASMSWSPDGKTLAYMGGERGDSIDLYTYQPETDTTQWLTSGPTQTVRPVWSPNGKYIVHLAVTGLGTGAGYGVDAMWAAYADDSGKPILLYSRPSFDDRRSGDELVLGWRDSATFWVATWTPGTDFAYIRSVTLGTGEINLFWDENFRDAAADLKSSTLLISKNEFNSRDVVSHAPGLYLYTVGEDIRQLSSEDRFGRVVWSPTMNRYYVEVPKEARIVAVTPDGTLTELPIPTLPQALKAGDFPSLVWLQGTRLTISDQANDGALGAPRQLAADAYHFVVVCPACE